MGWCVITSHFNNRFDYKSVPSLSLFTAAKEAHGHCNVLLIMIVYKLFDKILTWRYTSGKLLPKTLVTGFMETWTCDKARTWWRHQMETFFALLAICAGNSPITGEFPSQRPVMRSFDVFFDLRLDERWSKQSWGWWFETPPCPLWRHSLWHKYIAVSLRQRNVYSGGNNYGITLTEQ